MPICYRTRALDVNRFHELHRTVATLHRYIYSGMHGWRFRCTYASDNNLMFKVETYRTVDVENTFCLSYDHLSNVSRYMSMSSRVCNNAEFILTAPMRQQIVLSPTAPLIYHKYICFNKIYKEILYILIQKMMILQ